MTDLDDLVAARAAVRRTIEAAAARVGRDPGGVSIVAVSKTVAPERILAASVAGFDAFGENRVQERAAKAEATATANAAWHLVGPLQSNKARRAVKLFDVIETVDSLALAERVSRISSELRPGRSLPVFLQVNVDEDAAKAGFEPIEMERDLAEILELRGIAVEGLMTVGRLVERPELARPTFVGLRALSERLRARHPGLGPGLSMGMSEDYSIAVEEGATLVRIGRAIFGERRPLA